MQKINIIAFQKKKNVTLNKRKINIYDNTIRRSILYLRKKNPKISLLKI